MPFRCPFLTWLIASCMEPLKCSDLSKKGKFCLLQNCNGLTIMVHVYIFIHLWENILLQERTKTVEVNFHKHLNNYFAWFVYLQSNLLSSEMSCFDDSLYSLKEPALLYSLKQLILLEIVFLKRPWKDGPWVTTIFISIGFNGLGVLFYKVNQII